MDKSDLHPGAREIWRKQDDMVHVGIEVRVQLEKYSFKNTKELKDSGEGLEPGEGSVVCRRSEGRGLGSG